MRNLKLHAIEMSPRITESHSSHTSSTPESRRPTKYWVTNNLPLLALRTASHRCVFQVVSLKYSKHLCVNAPRPLFPFTAHVWLLPIQKWSYIFGPQIDAIWPNLSFSKTQVIFRVFECDWRKTTQRGGSSAFNQCIANNSKTVFQWGMQTH